MESRCSAVLNAAIFSTDKSSYSRRSFSGVCEERERLTSTVSEDLFGSVGVSGVHNAGIKMAVGHVRTFLLNRVCV